MVVEAKCSMISDETRNKSEQDMISFFRSIPAEFEGSFGLMGGWAVTYLLKNRGFEHPGSRDIDIFYDPGRVSYETVSKMIRGQRFQPHSTFRWIKYIDGRTGKEISEHESKTLEQFNLNTIYLDVAAPSPDESRSVRDHVLDEPLLADVFSGKSECCMYHGARILMPSVDIMVKLKMKSVPERTDGFKREKDLVDLVAMVRNVPELWVTDDKGFQVQLRGDLRDPHMRILKQQLELYSRDGTLTNVANELRVDSELVLGILRRL